MPNHFHWLIKVKELDDLRPDLNSDHPSKSNSVINRALEKKGLKSDVKNEKITNQVTELNESIGILLRSYTRAINRAFAFKGSLFQQGTKAKNVNPEISMRDNYALVCFLYIHQNPIRAGLVNHFEDWHFSSFRDYAGFRNGKLCNQSLAKQLLFLPETVDDFIRFSNQTLPENYQYKIF